MDLISKLYAENVHVHARLLRILAADEEKHESRGNAPQWKMLKMLTKNKEVRFLVFRILSSQFPFLGFPKLH